MMSLTGSVLVYSNELYNAATPKPILTRSSSPRLSDSQLAEAATRFYRGYRVVRIGRALNPDEAIDVWLQHGRDAKHRLFDPRTGDDLGDAVPTGIWLVSRLIDLHDNLLAGSTGRKVNGLGALALLVLASTGMVIWWPGIAIWRRSLTVPHGLGWRRLTWHLHSTIGFWSLAFIFVFGISGVYLSWPEMFQNFADRIEPPTATAAQLRIADRVIYWLAFFHFGRINGIGIPCSGPGLCDQTTKAIWAVFGLAPSAMFVTGAMMWWNRVVRARLTAWRNLQKATRDGK